MVKVGDDINVEGVVKFVEEDCKAILIETKAGTPIWISPKDIKTRGYNSQNFNLIDLFLQHLYFHLIIIYYVLMNNIYDEIKWFLEKHPVSELLKIIADVVELEVENE